VERLNIMSAFQIIALKFIIVGGQATANGHFRRCWSPDQQRQFGTHQNHHDQEFVPLYITLQAFTVFLPLIIHKAENCRFTVFHSAIKQKQP